MATPSRAPDTLEIGQRVRIAGTAQWAVGALGVVTHPPDDLAGLGGGWVEGVRIVDRADGPVRVRWVELDEPVVDDDDEDGGYLAGEVDEADLEPIDDGGPILVPWDEVGELFEGGADALVTLRLAGDGWARQHVVARKGALLRCADPSSEVDVARVIEGEGDVRATVLDRLEVGTDGVLVVTAADEQGSEVAIVAWRTRDGLELVDLDDPEAPGRTVSEEALLTELDEALQLAG